MAAGNSFYAVEESSRSQLKRSAMCRRCSVGLSAKPDAEVILAAVYCYCISQEALQVNEDLSA